MQDGTNAVDALSSAQFIEQPLLKMHCVPKYWHVRDAMRTKTDLPDYCSYENCVFSISHQ